MKMHLWVIGLHLWHVVRRRFGVADAWVNAGDKFLGADAAGRSEYLMERMDLNVGDLLPVSVFG